MRKRVKQYRDGQPLFSRIGVESQLDAMFSPTVQLRSGGYIVINQTEALVAIDVNSGRSTREHHIEDTALKTNLEAAEEVARQLRLRDLAGLIVIDFIDMDEKRNNRSVERKLKDCLRAGPRPHPGRPHLAFRPAGNVAPAHPRQRAGKLDRALPAMRRQRPCPLGVFGGAAIAARARRNLMKGATHNLVVRTRTDVALYVLNHKRGHLRDLEDRFDITITVFADPDGRGAAVLHDRSRRTGAYRRRRRARLPSRARPVAPHRSRKTTTSKTQRRDGPEAASERGRDRDDD